MLYFAYGSNLDTRQMAARCPDAQIVGPAVLRHFALCFTGYSPMRGGAVASLAKRRGFATPGLVYSLSKRDLMRLDGFEGYPFAYDRFTAEVQLLRGAPTEALVYINNNQARGVSGRDYLNTIANAYDRLGFDRQPLQLATWGLT